MSKHDRVVCLVTLLPLNSGGRRITKSALNKNAVTKNDFARLGQKNIGQCAAGVTCQAQQSADGKGAWSGLRLARSQRKSCRKSSTFTRADASIAGYASPTHVSILKTRVVSIT